MLPMMVLGAFALVLGAARAQDLPANVIYREGQTAIDLRTAVKGIGPGSVVVVGEEHGTLVQASQQMQIMETIRENGNRVSVGMEFFEFPQQPLVDSWRAGKITETDFLRQIAWKGFPFAAYREQALFANETEGATTLALNAPRELTGKIAKSGLASLNEQERALLPPDFTLGNPLYLERFKTIMGDHLPTPEAVGNYFAAQSTWDDTMAYKASEYLLQHPDQVLVIVVGEFHVQYGGGLPDRLRARGLQVTSFSLVNLSGLSDVEQRQAVEPSLQYGARADFVMTSRIQQ